MTSRTSPCPVCNVEFDVLRSRSVLVDGEQVTVYCSPACMEQKVAPPPVVAPVPPRPPSRKWWLLPAGGALVGALVLSSSLSAVATKAALEMAHAPKLASSMVGLLPQPEPPPLSELLTADYTESPRWVHPLYGPERKFPIRPTRRFGAARSHQSPGECERGHCGVDLGEKRGEPVIAVHDGIVERVERQDDGKEGRFVRISHRRGTLVSAYMHLEDVRADLKPGMTIHAGEYVGTVGETGIQHSGPHLHFAMTTRRAPGEAETYLDPEPMLHVWQLEDAPLPRSGRR